MARKIVLVVMKSQVRHRLHLALCVIDECLLTNSTERWIEDCQMSLGMQLIGFK